MIRAKFLALGVLLGGAVLSHADVLVNTFGSSGVGYFPTVGWNINSTQSLGKTFSIANDYTFTDINIALRMDGDSDQMLVSLRSDAAGQPGSTLESFTVTNSFGASTAGVYVLNSASNPLMTAGTYYVTIEPVGDSTGKWNLSNAGGQGSMVTSNDGGSSWTGFTDTNGTVSVHGALAVPEPASMAALGLGALGLIRRRRKS